MGDSEITGARNYQVGANGRLWMDTLPLTGEYTTYALQESNPSLIDYVTDGSPATPVDLTDVDVRNTKLHGLFGLILESPHYQLQ